MGSRLLTACLARNEASRFLPSALEAWSQFSDHICLLDDASTDATADLAREVGATVCYRADHEDRNGMWGREASARALLWRCALESAREAACDYILIADADQTLARDPRPLLASEPDAVAFRLYDMWSENEYRRDGFWQAHETPRTWLVRVQQEPEEGWVWSYRGVHVGHLPLNFPLRRIVYAPQDHSWLHMAYSTPELREAKHAQYLSVAEQLSDFERAHADSILAPAETSPLPFEPTYRLQLANA